MKSNANDKINMPQWFKTSRVKSDPLPSRIENKTEEIKKTLTCREAGKKRSRVGRCGGAGFGGGVCVCPCVCARVRVYVRTCVFVGGWEEGGRGKWERKLMWH